MLLRPRQQERKKLAKKVPVSGSHVMDALDKANQG